MLPFVSLLLVRIFVALTFEFTYELSDISMTRYRKNNHFIGKFDFFFFDFFFLVMTP